MEEKIEGIVLQAIRYGDTSLIVKILTYEYGIQSYIIKGAFNKTSKVRAALFQQMSLIKFVHSKRRSDKSLGFIKEVIPDYCFQSIPFVMNKVAITMFMSEILAKTLSEPEKNDELYHFVKKMLLWLDLVDDNYANFPLYFTLEVSKHLGFYPKNNSDKGQYFDMAEGCFCTQQPLHPYYSNGADCHILGQLLGLSLPEICSLTLSNTDRRNTLDLIIQFMRLHTPTLRSIQSHEILREVL